MTDTKDREALTRALTYLDLARTYESGWIPEIGLLTALAREQLARLDAPVLTKQAVREALSCYIQPSVSEMIDELRDLGAFAPEALSREEGEADSTRLDTRHGNREATEPRQESAAAVKQGGTAESGLRSVSAGAPDDGTDEHPAIKDIRMLRDAALSHGMPATLNMHTENAVLRVRDLIAKRDALAEWQRKVRAAWTTFDFDRVQDFNALLTEDTHE